MHQTKVVGFDIELGLLISECSDCSFRAGAFPGKRPRILERGDPYPHQWGYMPDSLTPEQWASLGVEPMGNIRLTMDVGDIEIKADG